MTRLPKDPQRRREVSRLLNAVALATALLGWPERGAAEEQGRLSVTVRQLFEQGHRLEVTAGTEVVWADPHFDRVWLRPGPASPKVERVSGGFRAMFTRPGTYRGVFTVVGAFGAADVYDMTVVVNPRSQ